MSETVTVKIEINGVVYPVSCMSGEEDRLIKSSKEEGVYSGNVIIMTNDTNPAQARVEVGYKVRILHGGISIPGGHNNFGLLGWRKEYDPSCISNPKLAKQLRTKGSICE